MYFCVLLCTYSLYDWWAVMTQVMRLIIYISNVVNVGFILHVHVGVCPLYSSGLVSLTGTWRPFTHMRSDREGESLTE